MTTTAAVETNGPVSGFSNDEDATIRQGSSHECAASSSESFLELRVERCAQLSGTDSAQLATSLLRDLRSKQQQWPTSTRLHACKLVKELSRSSDASRALASADSIGLLISLTGTRDEQQKCGKDEQITWSSDEYRACFAEEQDLLLRALNNILLQHGEARKHFTANDEGLVSALHTLKDAHMPMLIFLTSRLLFFGSLCETDALKKAVEEHEMADILAQQVTFALQQQQQQAAEYEGAMTELLKAAFNITVFYPKTSRQVQASPSADHAFDEALLPLLAPSVAVLTILPKSPGLPLVAPVSSAIAVLLNFPVAPYRSIWDYENDSRPQSRSSSVDSGMRPQSAAVRAKRIARGLFRNPSKRKQPSAALADAPPILASLLDLLRTSCQYIFGTGAESVDREAIAHKAVVEGIDVEHTLEPAVLLLRKLADEVEEYRTIAKDYLLPSNIDRKVGIDQRSDLVGTLARLMSSVSYPRLARACGEAMLAICGGQAKQLTAELGYGPCAGFLVSIGQGDALAPSSNGKTSSHQKVVDPITGKYLPSPEELAKQDAESGLASMTEEEKEAEAERLFGLFNRLDRSGVIKVGEQHPMRQAVNSGKISELDGKDEAEELERLRLQDEEDEAEAEMEMSKYRARAGQKESSS